MNPHRNRLLGRILIVTALLGWLISLGGLVGVWVLQPSITQSAVTFLNLGQRTLETTGQLLDVIDTSLAAASDNITVVQTMLTETAGTFDKTSPMLQSAASMVGNDFAKMTTETRNALISLKSSAKIVDDSLRFISRIPLIGSPYNPPAPLDVSISNLAASMDNLPANLAEIQAWLNSTGSDLQGLQKSTSQFSLNMGTLIPNLAAARTTAAQYKVLVQDLKNEFGSLQANLPTYIFLAAVVLSLFLVWLAFAQLGTFFQGVEQLRR